MTPVERALTASLLWMTAAAATAIPLLIVPAPSDPLLTFVVQLSVLTVFAVSLTFHLAPLSTEPWFDGLDLAVTGRRALTWVVVIVFVVGSTGLVTVATSAALRFDPSLQFLQLLSALDIAWVVAALALGSRRWLGGGPALVLSGAVGVVCVWAVWRYLDVVGFTADGGWLVDGAELRRLVIPYDMAAAVLAIIVFTIGINRSRTAA